MKAPFLQRCSTNFFTKTARGAFPFYYLCVWSRLSDLTWSQIKITGVQAPLEHCPDQTTLVQRKEVPSVQIKLSHGLVCFLSEKFCWDGLDRLNITKSGRLLSEMEKLLQ